MGGGDFTNISRTSTYISLDVDDEYNINEPLPINAILTDMEDNPISEALITIQATFQDNTTYTTHDITNNDGEWDTIIPSEALVLGTCTIQATYNGNKQYKSTTETVTTTIMGGGLNQ